MKKLIALMCFLSLAIAACGPKPGPVTNPNKEEAAAPDPNIDWGNAPAEAAKSPAEPAAAATENTPASKPSADAPSPK